MPLSQGEKLVRGTDLVLSQDVLNAIQAGMMALGFAIAVLIILRRSQKLYPATQHNQGKITAGKIFPSVAFCAGSVFCSGNDRLSCVAVDAADGDALLE